MMRMSWWEGGGVASLTEDSGHNNSTLVWVRMTALAPTRARSTSIDTSTVTRSISTAVRMTGIERAIGGTSQRAVVMTTIAGGVGTGGMTVDMIGIGRWTESAGTTVERIVIVTVVTTHARRSDPGARTIRGADLANACIHLAAQIWLLLDSP